MSNALVTLVSLMSSEHSEISDVMGKHTAGPSSPWCKGLFTLACYDPWIRGDVGSAAAALGYSQLQHVVFLHQNSGTLVQLVSHSFATRLVLCKVGLFWNKLLPVHSWWCWQVMVEREKICLSCSVLQTRNKKAILRRERRNKEGGLKSSNLLYL